MWEPDREEGKVLKNWCFQIVVLEKTLGNPLDCKEIKSVNPKNQPWIFIGKSDAEAEAPILWQLDAKSWLTGKDPDAGKGWRQKEKGTAENEMADTITNSTEMNLSKLRENMKDREAWHTAVHGVTKGRTWLSNWTTTNSYSPTSLNKCFALWFTPMMPHSVRSKRCR